MKTTAGISLAGLPARRAGFVEPMKCRVRPSLPSGDGWVFEIKFDGFRGLAIKRGTGTQLRSRNDKELGPKFPELVRAIAKLEYRELVLDGEIVALDAQGRPAFQLLQRAGEPGAASGALFYYAFDILNYNGRDTTGLPLRRRKELLQKVLEGAPENLRFSGLLPGAPGQLIDSMRQLGLEGLIAKKRDSVYEAGRRSGAWVKYKWAFEQEFVIGGYTDPEGSRPFFGSILAGYYEGEKLIFAGRIGTGFDARSLKSLHALFQKIRAAKTPFANLPELGGPVGAAQMRSCKWVLPKLVCQVRFAEWTAGHHLRQPVFLGLRKDKSPREVIREE